MSSSVGNFQTSFALSISSFYVNSAYFSYLKHVTESSDLYLSVYHQMSNSLI